MKKCGASYLRTILVLISISNIQAGPGIFGLIPRMSESKSQASSQKIPGMSCKCPSHHPRDSVCLYNSLLQCRRILMPGTGFRPRRSSFREHEQEIIEQRELASLIRDYAENLNKRKAKKDWRHLHNAWKAISKFRRRSKF
eukprot:TRINITY_DN23884_c0_g1_i1.p1 TRINITY_DN23884_c0_g1~~TRINITY_DN23884_c0_g1_i1.p1  ORF type:complete len:141 (-),score=28.53 TRINITY_DN23884_c0_g1_i1:47-469(-)